MKKSLTSLITIITTSAMVGCQTPPVEFDGMNAFSVLEKQCEFGPRNPGSQGYNECKNYLINILTRYADTVFTQPFQYTELRDHKTYELENIIAQFNPTDENHLLLGAHWDTRPWADSDQYSELRNEPILGANDGASGVAVLLEIARLFKINPPPIAVTIVLLDGEDLGVSGSNESFAQGSQYFAKNLPIAMPDNAIILDMIGDTDLSIPIERNSYQIAPKLVKELWRMAENLHLSAFESTIDKSIYDDHIPLWDYAGIPAVDIIDFEYPNARSNYWHTHDDVPGNCSPESLEQVGTLLVHYIWSQRND
ncbi:MAG: M28 family peptidase [Candidatus Marinimicrobia bacterium]|nr:M28 family peptidase [Candidatus Neomarinimicrobiota bacterium]